MQSEAMTKENWMRQEKGLPPIKPKRISRPEPEPPEVENEVRFEDILKFSALLKADRQSMRNKDGMLFPGYDVTLIAEIKAARKPGRPKESEKETPSEPKAFDGWMREGEFMQLVRTYRQEINPQVIHW